MADFCQTCDPGRGGLRHIAPKGEYAWALCECCGPTYVNHAGDCVRIGCDCTRGRCINGGPGSHDGRKETIEVWMPYWPVRCVDGGWAWLDHIYRFRVDGKVFYRREFRVWG